MNKWISVEDRLPRDIIDFVLVARNTGVNAVMEANFIDGKFITWRYGQKQEFINPTHWMPLPEPPKDKSND